MKMTPPMTDILAATDLRSDSLSVLDAAGGVARLSGARLHLIHVLGGGDVPARVRSRDPQAEAETLDEARQGLWAQGRTLADQGVEVASTVVVRSLSPDRGILEHADATGADLIVLGSHAREATRHRLGSTADRVLRTAAVPCLVIRGAAHFPVHRAAVLTDFSAAARAGLRVAFSWLPGLGLAEPEGRLDVLHASWPEEPELRDATAGWMEDLLDKEIAEASSGLSDRPTRVRPHLVWRSPPTEAVAEEVRREDYQLLVVSTRGLGRVRRGLLGSVTLGLLHTAPCPVLAVPRKRRKR